MHVWKGRGDYRSSKASMRLPERFRKQAGRESGSLGDSFIHSSVAEHLVAPETSGKERQH